jgi:hypothetical protein
MGTSYGKAGSLQSGMTSAMGAMPMKSSTPASDDVRPTKRKFGARGKSNRFAGTRGMAARI